MNRLLLLASAAFLLNFTPGVAQNEPPEVQVVKPVSRMVTDYEPVTGFLEPSARVDLRARVTGFLEQINFKEGSLVRKGEVLFAIDSRPAQAQFRLAQAKLMETEASHRLAKANLERAMELVKRGAISREEADRSQTELNQILGALEVAKLQVDVARLQLDFTKVLAPIDGIIGRRLVDPGNLVRADETLLATILSVDPMHFSFALKEPIFLRLRKRTQDGQADPNASKINLGLMNEDGFPRQGTIDFVDNQIDPKTKTCRIRGTLAKSDGLLPGLSIRGRILLGQPYQAILIPMQTHFVRFKDGEGVYKVQDNKLVLQKVELGNAFDDLVVVKSGLTPDDRVVLAPGRGFMLEAGLPVRPKVAPTGEDSR